MFDAIDKLSRRIDDLNGKGGVDYYAGSWTPTLNGFSVDPTNSTYQYILVGHLCTCFVYQQTAGTSDDTVFTITAPFNAVRRTDGLWAFAFNNGAQLDVPGRVSMATGSNVMTLTTSPASGGAWTNANGKRAGFTFVYETE